MKFCYKMYIKENIEKRSSKYSGSLSNLDQVNKVRICGGRNMRARLIMNEAIRIERLLTLDSDVTRLM